MYTFTATPWKHTSPGGWIFVSLPSDMAKEIRANLQREEQGWGRLKAKARIGGTIWETAIWFDTRLGTYLLPLKAEVRKAEGIMAGSELRVMITI